MGSGGRTDVRGTRRGATVCAAGVDRSPPAPGARQPGVIDGAFAPQRGGQYHMALPGWPEYIGPPMRMSSVEIRADSRWRDHGGAYRARTVHKAACCAHNCCDGGGLARPDAASLQGHTPLGVTRLRPRTGGCCAASGRVAARRPGGGARCARSGLWRRAQHSGPGPAVPGGACAPAPRGLYTMPVGLRGDGGAAVSAPR